MQTICDFVHSTLGFAYGSSTPHDGSRRARRRRRRVPDFTHLAITYCRALNIPARYAFGYLPALDTAPLPDPMDFAAWMEVLLHGSWWTYGVHFLTAYVAGV